MSEAREQAWRAWMKFRESENQDAPAWRRLHIAWNAGWDARGRYDDQRIAELVAAGQEIWQWANSAHSAYQSPATQMREAAMWQRLGSALSELRALGQLEEVKP